MLLTNDSMLSDIQDLFRHPLPPHGKNKKIRAKRQVALLNYPLFTTIYQKKGQHNFHIIAEQIIVKNYQYGFTIIDYQEAKTFNYIIQGTAMIFKINVDDPKASPILHKRIYKNQYFGSNIGFEPGFVLHSVKSVSNCLVFQLNLETFYKTFAGHFSYPQLKSKIQFLQQIWAFKHIRRRSLERILLVSKIEKLRRNQILFRPRQPVEKVYLIIQGEITLFKRQDGINRPFCVLTSGQLIGLQQIRKQIIFSYGAVCTHQGSALMIIDKKIAQQIICSSIDQQKCQEKISINQQLKQNQKILTVRKPKRTLTLKHQSGYQSIQQIKLLHQHRYDQTNIEENSLDVQSKNIALKKQYQLKHPEYRQFKLRQTRQSLRERITPSKLSEYANKSFSGQKCLLFKYLMKKQVKDQSISQQDIKFRSTQFPIAKEFKATKSAAVKNHKRKLRKSRKNNTSSNNSSARMYTSCTFLGKDVSLHHT